MRKSRGNFLSDSALADQKQSAVDVCNAAEQWPQFAASQSIRRKPRFPAVHPVPPKQQMIDAREKFLHLEWLGQIVVGTGADQPHGLIDAAIARDE